MAENIKTDLSEIGPSEFSESMRDKTLDDILGIEGIGDKIAESIFEWFKDEKTLIYWKN